jgi:hypothetical protein
MTFADARGAVHDHMLVLVDAAPDSATSIDSTLTAELELGFPERSL